MLWFADFSAKIIQHRMTFSLWNLLVVNLLAERAFNWTELSLLRENTHKMAIMLIEYVRVCAFVAFEYAIWIRPSFALNAMTFPRSFKRSPISCNRWHKFHSYYQTFQSEYPFDDVFCYIKSAYDCDSQENPKKTSPFHDNHITNVTLPVFAHKGVSCWIHLQFENLIFDRNRLSGWVWLELFKTNPNFIEWIQTVLFTICLHS